MNKDYKQTRQSTPKQARVKLKTLSLLRQVSYADCCFSVAEPHSSMLTVEIMYSNVQSQLKFHLLGGGDHDLFIIFALSSLSHHFMCPDHCLAEDSGSKCSFWVF